MQTFVLIEDNPDHAALVELSLPGRACGLRCFASGRDALAFLDGLSPAARSEIAAILLDLKLEDENGLDVLRAIRERGWMAPVVVLTTSDRPTDREQAYALRASSYLVKPVQFQQFKQLMGEVADYWGDVNERPWSGAP